MKNSALVLQNLQIDYCPGGAMEVANGLEIIQSANALIPCFSEVIAAIDWHPANHISFAGNHPWRHIGQTLSIDGMEQELLPFHCVANTFGAHLHPSLDKDKISHTIQQGTLVNRDNYSCFFDIQQSRETGLLTYLENKNIRQLFFVGMPLEANLKYSILDALALDFSVFLIKDGFGMRKVDSSEERTILRDIQKAGTKIVDARSIMG